MLFFQNDKLKYDSNMRLNLNLFVILFSVKWKHIFDWYYLRCSHYQTVAFGCLLNHEHVRGQLVIKVIMWRMIWPVNGNGNEKIFLECSQRKIVILFTLRTTTTQCHNISLNIYCAVLINLCNVPRTEVLDFLSRHNMGFTQDHYIIFV